MNAKELLTCLQDLEEADIDLESIDLLEYLKPKHLRRLNRAIGRFILYCGARGVYMTDRSLFDYDHRVSEAARFISEADALFCIPRARRDAEWEWQIHLLLSDNSATFFQDVKF